MHRAWIVLGSLAGLTGVALAALAAHALPGRLDPGALGLVRNGIEMQMYHAPALLACGLWAGRAAGGGAWLAHAAGAAFALGTLCFCGALYALGLGGIHLPSVAPAGGVLLMLGWGLLGASALVRQRPARPA